MRFEVRGSVAVAVLLAASGCGGDYSNADVEFAAAVPRRSDVTVRMPLTSGLTASGLRAEGATSLAYLDLSQTYAETRKAADGLDQMAGFFVGILEAVTRYDPTVRTPDLRVWGPFPNDKAPDWELQLAITRRPVQIDSSDPEGPHEGFYWKIEHKQRSATSWQEVPLAEGLYEPGEIRRGRGLVFVHVSEVRASGMPMDDFDTLAQIALGYDTRAGHPHTIGLDVTNEAAERVRASYQELDTGSGQLVFDINQMDPRATRLLAVSRWAADAAGRADLRVVGGTMAGVSATECWDAQQRVSFVDNPVEGVRDGYEYLCVFGGL